MVHEGPSPGASPPPTVAADRTIGSPILARRGAPGRGASGPDGAVEEWVARRDLVAVVGAGGVVGVADARGDVANREARARGRQLRPEPGLALGLVGAE